MWSESPPSVRFAGARTWNVWAGRFLFHAGAMYAGMRKVHNGSVGLPYQTDADDVLTHHLNGAPFGCDCMSQPAGI